MRAIILHNIRSAYNVGAIFRTADGAGFEKIYLTGYTPQPYDRFGRVQPEIEKTSLGASLEVPWEAVEVVHEVLDQLKQAAVSVVAVELTTTATSLKKFVPPPSVAYLFGNEVGGVPTTLLHDVDTVLAIPMLGKKESLNVSVAAGVIMYHDVVHRM